MISFAFAPEVYDCLLEKAFVPTADWAESHIIMGPDSKMQGQYRLDLFPHFREIFDAFDDPDVERITVQTAAQVGKTTFAQVCLAKTAAQNPHPMAFADADQRSTERVISRTWDLFERCDEIAPLCPPKRLQSQDRMRLKTCQIHGAWAGSASSAADYGAFVVVLNECDKMKARSTDTEADFRWLMGERTKGYVGAKIIEISTPSLKGVSYVELQRLKGDNRQRLVPCPHCNHFQELRTGNGHDPGGVRFQKLNGKLDPDKARETAYYECEACEKKIEEHHRYEMLNSGLWVPEGCSVKKGKLTGKPLRSCRHATFGPISTLHSLLPGGTIAKYAEAYVQALTAREQKSKAIQNFINSWEGKTYDPQPITVKADDLLERIGTDAPLRVCPQWSRFLTLAADVGAVGTELIFYWGACAWGLHSRGQLVDFGAELGSTEFVRKILAMSYPHADQGPPLRPAITLVDSGFIANTIYDLCRPLPGWMPIKGSSDDAKQDFVQVDFPEMYKPGIQRTDLSAAQVKAKLRARQYDLLICNTDRTQEWIEDRISGRIKTDESNWFSVPLEALSGQIVPDVNLTKHLLGDVKNARGNWVKRYDEQHFRDQLRYNVVAAWYHTQNGNNWNRLPPRAQQAPRPAQKSEDERRGFVRKMSRRRR